jgi:hypothetical protein
VVFIFSAGPARGEESMSGGSTNSSGGGGGGGGALGEYLARKGPVGGCFLAEDGATAAAAVAAATAAATAGAKARSQVQARAAHALSAPLTNGLLAAPTPPPTQCIQPTPPPTQCIQADLFLLPRALCPASVWDAAVAAAGCPPSEALAQDSDLFLGIVPFAAPGVSRTV